jgi:hypothetical protein
MTAAGVQLLFDVGERTSGWGAGCTPRAGHALEPARTRARSTSHGSMSGGASSPETQRRFTGKTCRMPRGDRRSSRRPSSARPLVAASPGSARGLLPPPALLPTKPVVRSPGRNHPGLPILPPVQPAVIQAQETTVSDRIWPHPQPPARRERPGAHARPHGPGGAGAARWTGCDEDEDPLVAPQVSEDLVEGHHVVVADGPAHRVPVREERHPEALLDLPDDPLRLEEAHRWLLERSRGSAAFRFRPVFVVQHLLLRSPSCQCTRAARVRGVGLLLARLEGQPLRGRPRLAGRRPDRHRVPPAVRTCPMGGGRVRGRGSPARRGRCARAAHALTERLPDHEVDARPEQALERVGEAPQ